MTAEIPSFTVTACLSAEEAAKVRIATKDAELELEEDIWGQRGILVAEDQDQVRVYIQPLQSEPSYSSTPLLYCPLTAIQNAQVESDGLNMQQCFFRTNAANAAVAEEVWLQRPVFPPSLARYEHQGCVITSNAHAKIPFCHVRLSYAVADNIECSAFSMSIRAADMVLGRSCTLNYEELIDQRTGRLKLVATEVCFKHLEGLITDYSLQGIFIEPTEEIRYGMHSRPLSTIFAAFDRCTTIQPALAIIGARVFYNLQGPLSAPEACDWQVEGDTFHPKWNLPLPPILNIAPPCYELLQDVRWFPWHPEETALVIASDPKWTKFRDDAFECELDEDAGSGFLRVHIVNMASRIHKDSPQEKWMRRVLSRHHPADADNTRTLFASWASTSAGIGFNVQEHRPALTMQLNMRLVEGGWAVDGPASFFESMVRLSVLVDSDKVAEEWVNKADDAPTPEALILHPLTGFLELERAVQQVFHDAQVVRDNRWRRLDANGQPDGTHEDSDATEGDEIACKCPQIRHEFNYNSNARTFTLRVEELQPSHFYAKRLLDIMNSEVFRVLDGCEELFGLADGASLVGLEDRRRSLVHVLSGAGLRDCQVYEDVATVEELEELVWKDLGASPAELCEAMGCGAHPKKMTMMADVPDGVHCHFEFTKPGRLYTQLVSQRIFLDFVRHGMKRPRRISHGMSELRALMESANQRRELNDKMVLIKHRAFLSIAWPQIMEYGGLPTEGIVVKEDAVFAWIIKEQVQCSSLISVNPSAPIGTKVIIQLQKWNDCYTSTLLAIHGRSPETFETPEAGMGEGGDDHRRGLGS